MNQESHKADAADNSQAGDISEDTLLHDDAEEAEEVEDEEAEAEEVGDEAEQWSEEFTPEELAELFGGEEKVPAQVLASAPEEAEVEEADEPDEEEEAGERLQKLLARSGVASRRAAEELIRAGRISVNNEVVTELGRRARPGKDRIAVDGKALKILSPGTTVVVLHKPRGCVSTKMDPQNRATVMEFLPKKLAHLHPVGRLDFDTSGLLLLTDDGDLTNLLLHPSHGVEKRYHARVRGVVDVATIERLQKGVRLDDGITEPCRVRVKAQTPSNALLEIVLREGRNRQIRRMLQAVGHPVSALRRVRVGGLDLGGLPAGAFRELLPGEVHLLKKAARASKPPVKAARPFAYKPRPSKAEDKTLPQAAARPSTRASHSSPESAPTRPRPTGARPTNERAPREANFSAPARDGASQDISSRDRAFRGAPPRGDAPRGGAPRSAAARDAAPRARTARDDDSRGAARPERPSGARPTPGASDRRPFNREASPASRPGARPRPEYRPEPREDRGARSEGGNRWAERASGAGPARDSRPSSPRPNDRRTQPPQARERDDAGARPSSGPSSRPARPSAPRTSAPRTAGGTAREGGPAKRSGSKLARKIEERFDREGGEK